jgi:hypothetical protein
MWQLAGQEQQQLGKQPRLHKQQLLKQPEQLGMQQQQLGKLPKQHKQQLLKQPKQPGKLGKQQMQLKQHKLKRKPQG